MKKFLVLTFALSSIILRSGFTAAQTGSQLRTCLRTEPKTLNPLLVADDASEAIRYLTGGVLIRLNRLTQQLEPELAESWKVGGNGSIISFTLRQNVYFSDGTPFTAFQQLMDPALHSPTGDSFRSSNGKVTTRVTGKNRITIVFPKPVVGLERLFDQVAIMSARSPKKEMAVLGPYYVAQNKAGAHLLLIRNPNYWKHDFAGRKLPYVDSVRLDIEQNRDIEILRFERGEIDFINSLDAEYYDRLMARTARMAYDAGGHWIPSRFGSIRSPLRRCRITESVVRFNKFPASDFRID